MADASQLRNVIADLDRCVHGRHRGDECTFPDKGCDGPSVGNTFLTPGQRIGTSIWSQRAIVVPDPESRMDPEAWYRDITDGA